MSEGEKRKTGLTANAVKHAKPRQKAYKLSDRDWSALRKLVQF